MSLLALALLLSTAPERADVQRWHRVVGVLEYVANDYPRAVESGDATELDEQRAFTTEAVEALKDVGAQAEPYRGPLEAMKTKIDRGVEPQAVREGLSKLAKQIVVEQQLVRAPQAPPDLKHAAQLWSLGCAVCHGENGDGHTALSATMNPPPASFHERERMQSLTPYQSFNAIGFGVTGTAMPAFDSLSDQERWELAFYLFTLRQPACDHPAPHASLDELATSSDSDLTTRHGAEHLACLRRVFRAPDEAGSFEVARSGLHSAQQLWAQGQHAAAKAAVIDAYLAGIEPVEPKLRARDPQRVAQLERAFAEVRLAAQNGGPFDEKMSILLRVLDENSGAKTSDFWSVFVAALLILLREGFEAVVVVGALLAVLKKLKATRHARTVHLGWSSALVVGALAFVFGHQLLKGANREWLETLVSLAAVGMLVYAALWLNARANVSRFMGELRGKLTAALGQGSAAGLFTIAFTSVLRESVETALFLEGLATDSVSGTVWGALAGLAALFGLVLLVSRVGFALPMKTLFNASTVTLLLTALMLLGKGAHGLQELGALPLRPLRFVHVEALGIFADAWTLAPQALFIVGCWLLWRLRRSAKPKTPPAAAEKDAAPTI